MLLLRQQQLLIQKNRIPLVLARHLEQAIPMQDIHRCTGVLPADTLYGGQFLSLSKHPNLKTQGFQSTQPGRQPSSPLVPLIRS